MTSRPLASIACIAYIIGAGALATTAHAEVKRLEILRRESFADGVSFGRVGPYEKISGRLHYAVDVDDPRNAAIADLALAPRDDSGEVTFVGDFVLLKPVDLSRGRHRLIYDVNNRGGLTIIPRLNGAAYSNAPTTPEHAGSGFLMRHGYTLLWSAWNWDVRVGGNRLQIDLPIARDEDGPITGVVAAEMITQGPATSLPVAWGGSRGYPATDGPARLTVRDTQRGERVEIPAERWRFTDPTHVHLDGGFEIGRIYEVVYTATDARVVGLGLAAIRDSLSFFRHETEDRVGHPNPLLDAAGVPDPEHAFIFGISQSGRVIQHMLWQGFHVDEHERRVFDGAMPHVSGAGKGSFNHRFAQTTRHPSVHEDHQYPADFFPFSPRPQRDPLSGREGGVFDTAEALGQIPKVIYTGTATEYWTRAASPLHTDLSAKTDVELPANARLYVIAGAQHGVSRSRARGPYRHLRNDMDHSPPLRALLLALDGWVSDGTEPPPSSYPRIDDHQLITAEGYAARFPSIPAVEAPDTNLQPPRLALGDRFLSEGIIEHEPPGFGDSYPTLVPAPDPDGNDLGGVRLPAIAVPLGTYTGWNFRVSDGRIGRWAGSFHPFAGTRAERQAADDPRRSLAERYATHDAYIDQVDDAVAGLVDQGFLLPEDAAKLEAAARSMSWPPSFEE